MQDVLLLAVVFGGPLLGLIALTLFALPSFRPMRLTRTIGWLCICLVLPTGLFFQYSHPWLVFKLATAILGLLAALAYLNLRHRLRLPLPSMIPAIILLLASLWDAFASLMMNHPGFAGASC